MEQLKLTVMTSQARPDNTSGADADRRDGATLRSRSPNNRSQVLSKGQEKFTRRFVDGE